MKKCTPLIKLKSWQIGLFLLISACPLYAHQPDKLSQETRIFLDQPSITIGYKTTYGAIGAALTFGQADQNKDGRISDKEQDVFLRQLYNKIQKQLTLQVDEINRTPVYAGGQLKRTDRDHLITQLILQVPGDALKEGRHTLFFSDHNYKSSVLESMDYLVHAGPNSETIKSSREKFAVRWEFICQEGLPGDALLESGQKAEGVSGDNQRASEGSRLSNLLGRDQLSVAFIMTALLIALGMGALHALSPGHGKAMVAAYLIGAKGTVKHAIILGGVVTLTHVSSVLLLGVVALTLSAYIMPQQLYPWLSAISGVMITLIGLWMLKSRLTGMAQGSHDHHHHDHDDGAHDPHGHHHHDDGAHDHHDHHDHAHHVHDDGGHHHAHNSHSHGHGHSHSHLPKGDITLSSLITLGISGGMVPCPTALVVLLVAVSLQRIFFGLGLILSFSLGLAFVLIMLGILIVKSARIISRFRGESRLIQFLPVLSASVIIVIGSCMIVNALLSANIIG